MMVLGWFKKPQKDQPTTAVVGPELLSIWHVGCLLENREPFKTWHAPQTAVPTQHREYFHLLAQAYLLYLWFLLVHKQFGKEVGAIVRADQADRLDMLGNHTGQNFETLITEIERAMRYAIENPNPPGSPEVIMPPEYYVALHMLTYAPGAPYFTSPEEYDRSGKLRDMNGNDWLLAECLAHCRDSATEHFMRALNTMTIDARALSEWKSARFSAHGYKPS